MLILGSGPNVRACQQWPRAPFDKIVAINNAWQVRSDWDYLIHPDDFGPDRRPTDIDITQKIIRSADYVPLQNGLGGFVYAGGTMAFTAAYWALAALKPRVIAFLGCDMVYDDTKQTHFYGTGTADPLRSDVTLRSLEAKSARFMALAAQAGCATINLSDQKSRLVFPRSTPPELLRLSPVSLEHSAMKTALNEERRLGYYVPSGKYWKEEHRFDPAAVDTLDAMWLNVVQDHLV